MRAKKLVDLGIFHVNFTLLIIGSLITGLTKAGDVPTVKIPQGVAEGIYKESYFGRTYAAFEGIPYAEPPIGKLRFAEPVPANVWEGTLVANETYMCMSFLPFPLMYGVRGTEDCLYVNVYVPRKQLDENENLDVVVHIHGGAFMMGSPEYMAGPQFIMDKDVVYVNFNYRLGVLGFLSTEDDVVPGNNGLKDQSLALKWIKNNIKYFGGNPNSITLTGLSAGGVSVHYHYLSPLSKGLFHRGFSQSGTVLQSWGLTEEPLQSAKRLSVSVDCPIDNTTTMIECLREKSGKKVVGAVKEFFVILDAVPFTPFGPVIEKGGEHPFISDHPYKILRDGPVYDVPWVVSNVRDEGLFPGGIFAIFGKLKELDEDWDYLIPFAMDIMYTAEETDKIDIATKVKQYYFKDEHLTMKNVYNLVKLFTDRTYLVDCEKAMRTHAKSVTSPVYYYKFSYVLELPSLFLGLKKGVAHSDDGRLLFPIIPVPSNLGSSDEEMMKHMTNFIVKYASTGIPSFADIEWKPINPSSPKIDFLDIQSPSEISMNSVKELAPNEFWDSLPIKENNKLF